MIDTVFAAKLTTGIKTPCENGQLVKKGDLIGQLDTADFIAARDSAKASFDAAKINFESIARLLMDGEGRGNYQSLIICVHPVYPWFHFCI